MGLTDALYTGLTGLDVNQAQLNVISNNIANVNTVGFKSSSAQFQTQFYQTISDGTAPSTTFGGDNPTQMGTGAELGGITQDFGQGSVQATGSDTDMAINGNGFFIVQGGTQLYTRDGAFTLNSNNQLVDSAGDFVQGYGVDKAGNIVAGQLTNLNIPIGQLTLAQATGNATLQGNLNPNGPVASGASILNSQAVTDITGGTPATPTTATNLVDLADISAPTTAIFTAGQTITVQGTRGGRDLSPDTLTVTGTTTVADLNAFLGQAMAIDGNVTNPAGTPTPGVTLEALPTDAANSATLVITGNLGADNALELSGTAITSSTGSAPLTFSDGTDLAGDASDPTGESAYTSFEVYDSLGTPITVDLTATLTGTSTTGTTWQFYATSPNTASAGTYVSQTGLGPIVGEGTISFDNNGNYVSSTGSTISIDRTNTGATQPLAVKLNFGNMSSLTATSSNLVLQSQDGSATGTLSSFSVGSDGIIAGTFSNGLTRNLGQVALATFANQQGLQDLGGNQFAASPASGVATVTTPTQLGTGTIQSGALEESNVDLSEQFTDLITASTGFDAASRVITTSDQLIQELLSSTNST
jgi:flagellar hook protein FlgE